MVGVFGLSKNGSPARTIRNSESATPPPPYSQNTPSSAVYATEMTTTTTHVVTTTTHTTTHFFSLPLWRRRGTPAYSPRDTPALSTDELGVMSSYTGPSSTPSTLHVRDKELPPTPDLSPDNSSPPSRQSPDSTVHYDSDDTTHTARWKVKRKPGVNSPASSRASSSRASSLQPVSRSSYAAGEALNTSQPTYALARAALGLGFPHAAPSSLSRPMSSSEVAAITVIPPRHPTSSDTQRPNMIVRHAKSFHVEHDPRPDAPPLSAVRERRRTRGLSLGPLHLISSDVKGKPPEIDTDAGSSGSGSKPLSRKGSFWSRRRVNSRVEPALVSPPSTHHLTLPAFPPVSPFNINTPVPSPGLSAPIQAPELQRRHSERARQKQSRRGDPSSPLESSRPYDSISIRRRRDSHRPQTADSTSNPRLSLFSESHPTVVSPTSSPLATPSERPTLPVSVHTDSRARAQATNPPLLHRLSVNLFGNSSSSNTTTLTSPPNALEGQGAASPPSSVGSPRPSLSKHSVEIPRPRSDEESPEVYLQRLVEAVSKAEVAIVLSSSADAFHARALRVYIERFNFVEDPLDVALRKLLMEVGLPRETQQIDRVIEAFAARYVQCNPNLFNSDDHPYILAFSLIMLHTDAFNKSNKHKMNKPDYIKNTRLPDVAPEVLDCFYDNIVFVPFIFIEDPLDVNGQRGLVPEAISRRMSTINAPSPGGFSGLGKNNKIDPYYLITRNLLSDLRVEVLSLIPPESPYHYQGTSGAWNEDELQRAFALAATVEVVGLESRYTASPWFGLSVSGGPGPMFQSSLGSLPPVATTSLGAWIVKVTKIGLLLRKDDTVEGGRRAMNRKWREWCVLLTGSQLLFFRDTTWAGGMQSHGEDGQLLLPQTALSQPDEMFTVRDTVAVSDKSYTKYANTFRVVMSDGRQLLLQAPNEKEMNEWIARINYASAFKTAGVRMRPLGLSSRDIELAGVAAAASHLKDMTHKLELSRSPVIHTWDGRSMEDLNGQRATTESAPTLPSESLRTRPGSVGSIVSNLITPPYENSSRLFKAAFDEVKTELAAGNWRMPDDMSVRTPRKRAYSLESRLSSPPMRSNHDKPRILSRPEIIKSKVKDLNSKIDVVRTQLDMDMRHVRNLAVLTPFQRTTRDRLRTAVQTVAKRVMQIRLEIEKLVCHRDVLTNDLAAEERDWQRTKRLAMRAATDKLEVQRVVREGVAKADGERVPKLTVSAYVDQTAASSTAAIPRTANLSVSADARAQDSSAAETSHSALCGTSTWHGRQRRATLASGSPTMFDSPSPSPSPIEDRSFAASDTPSPVVRHRAVPLTPQDSLDSTVSTLAGVLDSSMSMSDGGLRSSEGGSQEKFYTASEMAEEQAEEWNKTRAAKRVSLVKLPADLRISMLLGKHARDDACMNMAEEEEEDRATPTSATSPTATTSGLTLEEGELVSEGFALD